MYATLQDLRDEGLTESRVDDERAARLLREASATIDRLTGWWFGVRSERLRVSGTGRPVLDLVVPPIRIDAVWLDGALWPGIATRLVLEGAPLQPDFISPRVVLQGGAFPRGQRNIELRGRFGCTEADGTRFGRVPLEIRRACLLLALRAADGLATADAEDARSRWRILSERTRDQAVQFGPAAEAAPVSGDPEVDDILTRWRRPRLPGAA